jgi:hypothetical protein
VFTVVENSMPLCLFPPSPSPSPFYSTFRRITSAIEQNVRGVRYIQVRKRGAEEEPEEAPGDLARSWQEADQGAEHLNRSWQEADQGAEQQEAEMMDGRGELTPHQIAQLMSIIADMDSVKGLRGADTEVARGRSPPTDAELEEFISYMERGGARMQVRG